MIPSNFRAVPTVPDTVAHLEPDVVVEVLSTSAAELSVSVNNAPRRIEFRWRTSEDDERDAERAEAERLRDEGRTVVSIGWEKPPEDDGKLIEAKPASED
jgi:hypothetical protein